MYRIMDRRKQCDTAMYVIRTMVVCIIDGIIAAWNIIARHVRYGLMLPMHMGRGTGQDIMLLSCSAVVRGDSVMIVGRDHLHGHEDQRECQEQANNLADEITH